MINPKLFMNGGRREGRRKGLSSNEQSPKWESTRWFHRVWSNGADHSIPCQVYPSRLWSQMCVVQAWLSEDQNNRWDAELLKCRKRRCKAPAKIQSLPEKLNKHKTEGRSCSQLCAWYSWGGNYHSNGIWGAEGLSMAIENLFVVLFGEFSLSFLYFPFLFLCFIIPFLQGPQIPSQCSVSFGKWRPIYTCYLRVCGPEIKHSPKSSKPPGVTFTEHCEQ